LFIIYFKEKKFVNFFYKINKIRIYRKFAFFRKMFRINWEKIDCATTELFINIFFYASPFLLKRNQDEINSIGSRGREQNTEETPILSMGP